MGTIFQGLEDSYVQNVAAYNVFMYLMNNVKVRDYVKENELTLEQIVTHINDNWDDIINDFSTNPDYEMQSEDDIHTTVDAFAQMYEVAMKIVAENSEVSNTILKSPSWIEEYDRNDCHNGAVFEDEDGVYYVVFEGTIDAEWLDNGEALAGKESEQQENAVEYFNMVAQDLGWTTDDTIIVSGHSKGGNKAQYTTLYAAQPELIDYCISINGQGFSNMEEEEYYTKHSEQQRQEAIDKMYSLCGEYDYVHGLGNVIIPEERTTIIDLDNDKFYEDFVGVGHCMPWFFYRDGEFHGDLNPIGAESSLSGLVTEASNRVMELSDSELQNLTLASMQLMEIVNARSEDGYDMERASKENLEKCLVYAVPIILESIFATEPGQEFTKEIVDNLVAPKVQEYANDIIKEAKIKVLFFSIKSCFMVGEIARGILTGNININISNLYSFIESVIPDINASENDVQVEGALNGMLVGAEHEINKKFIEKENEWLDKFDGSEELSELAWELIVDSYYNIHGGQRDDMVYGTSDDNIIRLASGKVTTAYGRQGADTIFGSQQDDYLDGGSGNDTLYGNEGNDTLLGQKGCDSLYGGEGDDELAGGSNSDFLFGDAGNDKLDGGSAADYLYGGDGDDILTGGVGNDILIGGKGIDTYVIDAHHGDDIIVNHRIVNEENERDIILFEDDVKKENLTIQRRDADLLIVNNVNGQITTVKNVFITQRTPKTDDYDLSELVQGRIDGAGIIAESGVLYTDTNGLDVYSIPNIRFDDGTVWDKKEILKRLSVSGTKANDELEGISGVTQFYSADETFLAGDGEDKVYGNEGDDIIYGEGGNDKLSGGTGNDTIYGGSGTDYLYGDNGNDTLHGGVGNDTLIGGSGRNTYIINQDSDNDYIRLTDGEDSKIVFGKGIKSEDINVVRHYYGYRLENKVTGQTIRVQSYYTQDKTLVCEFDDGQIIDLNNVEVTKGTGGIKFSSYGSIDYESIDRMIMRLNVWNSSISSDIYFSKIKNDNKEYLRAKTLRMPVDPLVIDMQGNGFDLTSKANGVHFDLDANEMAEKVGWVAPQDALLVLDRNADGIISDGQELFGDSTVLSDGSIARNGFQALQDKDSNGDGIIDNQDEVFGQLKIWRDANQDGISDASEMVSLEACGIQKISLNATEQGTVDANSNATLRQQAEVYFGDGRVSKVGEFVFDADFYDTKEVGDVEAGVNRNSFGNMISLNTALENDTTGKLHNLVEEFRNAAIKDKGAICQNIIYHICGAEGIAANSRGPQMDARQLHVVETIMGEKFVGADGDNPNGRAGEVLRSIYDNFAETYYNLLNESFCFEEYISNLYYSEVDGRKIIYTQQLTDLLTWEVDSGNDCDNIISELGRYLNNLRNQCGVEGYLDFKLELSNYDKRYIEIVDSSMPGLVEGTSEDDVISLGNSLDVVNAWDGDDEVSTGYGNDIVNAGEGNDIVDTGEGNDTVYGDSGNDELYGENGNDTLIGGSGNDYMEGGAGADAYVFNLGDGTDTIHDHEYNNEVIDKIVFGAGISAEDVVMKRIDQNLMVKYSDTDSFVVQDAYVGHYGITGMKFVERMEFEDGTVWDAEYIASHASIHMGTEGDDVQGSYGEAVGYHQNETFHMHGGNDTVYAGEGNDTICGEEGNDTLYGENGNDTLIGGTGNDYMDGGLGADTYIIGAEDGNDTIYNYDYSADRSNDKISYGEGILVEDLSISRVGNDLVITNDKTEQTTVIADAYRNDNYKLYNLEFSDEDKAVIDYSATSLNITYAVKEEPISEESPVEVSPEDALVAVLQEEIAVSQDNASDVISETDIDRMADLLVQEMAGISTEGTVEEIPAGTAPVTDSDALLWVE